MKEDKFWKSMTRAKLIEELKEAWSKKEDLTKQNINLQQTITQLDKVALDKTLEIRDLKHELVRVNCRLDATLMGMVLMQHELKQLQTEYLAPPDNRMRFEFNRSTGQWQEKKDSVALAT